MKTYRLFYRLTYFGQVCHSDFVCENTKEAVEALELVEPSANVVAIQEIEPPKKYVKATMELYKGFFIQARGDAYEIVNVKTAKHKRCKTYHAARWWAGLLSNLQS